MIRTERNAPPEDDLIYDDVSVAAANGGGGGALGGHSYITLNGVFFTKNAKISTIFHFDRANDGQIYHILCVKNVKKGPLPPGVHLFGTDSGAKKTQR